MLRITVQSDPSVAKSYFQAKSHDYYIDGAEQPGVWHGHAAKLLGLSGEVRKADWDRLCDNQHPQTGGRLTERSRAGRRVLYDFTWSLPKSCSLAALNDDRITAAFELAVTQTMADIEREVLTRDQRGGAETLEPTGNLVWALHRHATSRPVNGTVDPQSHIHAAVLNATHHDGRWTALELVEVKREAPYWEAVMLSRMADSLTKMGYAVQRTGKFFELAGIETETLDKFSRRTQLIEQTAKERGVTDPNYKAELGGKTRERKKEGMTYDALKAEWVSRLTDSERQQLSRLTEHTAELPTVEQSTRHALDHVFERTSVASPRRVYESALRHGYGAATVEAVQAEATRQGLIVKNGQSTTKAALARERRLIRWARDGKGTVKPLASVPVTPAELTPGQATAVRHILSSQDRLVLVQGQAGTGKTTLLKAVVSQLDCPVRAVAISAAATEELRAVTPHAATVARFLADERMQDELRGGVLVVDEASLVGTVQAEQLTQVLERIDARTVWVGDTQQHAGVQAGAPFLAVQRFASLQVARVSEVVRQDGLYRNVAEHLAAGRIHDGLDLLSTMGWVHEAAHTERMHALATDYLWAVSNKLSVACVAPTHEEVNAVNAAVRERLKAAGRLGEERTFLALAPVSLTEAERRDAVGLAERDDLVAAFHRGKGQFRAGDRVAVTKENAKAVAAVAGVSAVYRRGAITLAAGDRVRVTSNATVDGHRLTNGTTYGVKAVGEKGITLDNGWTLPPDFGHLAPGYCSTSHASQGRTVDVVLVSLPARSLPAVGSDTAYVALTRGKLHAYLFTDSLDALREAASRDRTKQNASDLFPQGRVMARVKFVNRIKQIAAKAAAQVRQLTHRKERDYGTER